MSSVYGEICRLVDDCLCHYLLHHNVQWTAQRSLKPARKLFVEALGNKVIELGQTLKKEFRRVFDGYVLNFSIKGRFKNQLTCLCYDVLLDNEGFNWESVFLCLALIGELSLLCSNKNENELIPVTADALNIAAADTLEFVEKLGGLDSFVSCVLMNFRDDADENGGKRAGDEDEEKNWKNKMQGIGGILQHLRPKKKQVLNF